MPRISGSNSLTSNSEIVFTVCCIWSMASSIDVDQVLDVAAVERGDERAAHRLHDVMGNLVGLVFLLDDDAAKTRRVFSALEELGERLGARDQRLSVPLEQVEELVLSGKKFLEPVHHGKFSVFGGCRDCQWRRRVSPGGAMARLRGAPFGLKFAREIASAGVDVTLWRRDTVSD